MERRPLTVHNHKPNKGKLDNVIITTCFIISLIATIGLFLLSCVLVKQITGIYLAGLNSFLTMFALFWIYQHIINDERSGNSCDIANNNKRVISLIAITETVIIVALPLADVAYLLLR